MFRDRIFSILKNDSCPQHPSYLFQEITFDNIMRHCNLKEREVKGRRQGSITPAISWIGWELITDACKKFEWNVI